MWNTTMKNGKISNKHQDSIWVFSIGECTSRTKLDNHPQNAQRLPQSLLRFRSRMCGINEWWRCWTINVVWGHCEESTKNQIDRWIERIHSIDLLCQKKLLHLFYNHTLTLTMDSGFNSIKAIVDTVIMIVNVIIILRSSKKKQFRFTFYKSKPRMMWLVNVIWSSHNLSPNFFI